MASVETNLTVSCTSEYPDYKYNEQHDIWALVTLTAPSREDDESEDKRAAMDIVAVMDKSGSMAGAKLKLVKLTLEFVLTQLTSKDRFALITYDTNVYVDFALMNMTKSNKELAKNKITNIRDGSCTNLCGGLLKGLCQIIDRAPASKNDVASVLLFTDGLANEGITNVAGIIAAMKNPKQFDGPTRSSETHRSNPQAPAPHTSWLRRIFPGGSTPAPQQCDQIVEEPTVVDSRESASSSTSTGTDATVYTFGFGADHNADMLKQIAEAGNGMYYFIETQDKIGESFANCLGGLMSTLAQGIQLEIVMEPGASIKDVHTTRPAEKDGGQSVKVNIGDLQSEETRDIVLELSIDAVPAPYDTTPQTLLKAQVNYFNVITNNLETASGSLGVLRPEAASVHDDSNVDVKLTKEKCRVDMARVMKAAGEKAAAGDYEGTRCMLNEEINAIKSRKAALCNNAEYTDDIDEEFNAYLGDLGEYEVGAASSTAWESKGRNLQMNLVQQYECQRSANVSSNAFQTKAKKGAVKKSKSFFK